MNGACTTIISFFVMQTVHKVRSSAAGCKRHKVTLAVIESKEAREVAVQLVARGSK